MLDIKSISKKFGDKTVLDSVTLSLNREVVALVGNNGVGKTTLFKIISGEIDPDNGNINTNEVIGYLPQQFVFGELSITEFLPEKPEYEIDTILKQLGLSHLDKRQKAGNLSGGEKTKLYLVYLLLSDPKPTLLLLDEPTNNLDLESVFWLEEFIINFDGSIFLTSHDRALLDETVDRIIELDNGKVKQYGGNYSFYKKQKEIEKQAYERMYIAQEKKIEKIEEDINTIRSKTLQGEKKFSSRDPYQRRKIRKAAQQGVARRKKLEKFLASEKRLEKPEDKNNYPFCFEGDTHSDKYILGMKNICKSYDGRIILNDVSFSITGDQHVWLSGMNGSGKSTILKLLANQITPDHGKIEIGTLVKIGYFSQDILSNKRQNTVLHELMTSGVTETDVYRYAKFLSLESEDVVKQLSALSRGQRTKVEFIKLLMGNNHILILDEPTNHLEIDTREQIEEALRYYEGAILVASHDRYFLEKISIDKEIEIKRGLLKEVF